MQKFNVKDEEKWRRRVDEEVLENGAFSWQPHPQQQS
jgi:hypothetical protein